MERNQKKRNIKKLYYIHNILMKRLKALYLLEMVYLLAVYLILEKVINTVFTGLLHIKGYSYLTAEMMVAFFSSPSVILVMVGILFLVCVLVTILQLFVFEYVEQTIREKRASFFQVCRKCIIRCMRLGKRHPLALFLLIVEMVVYQNLASLVLAGTYLPKANYIIRAFLKLPYMKWLCIVLVLSFGLFYFRYYFTVSCLIYEKNSFMEAKKKSLKFFRIHYKKVVAEWFGVQILTVCMTVLFYMFMIGVSIVTVIIFVPENTKIAVFCTIREHIQTVVFWFAMMFGSTVQVVVASVNFHTSQKERKELEKVSEKETILHRKLLASIIVVILCMDIVVTYDKVQRGQNATFQHMGGFTITSHRGASWGAPENTIPAILLAMEEGADYIEIDVQETKDGEIVLMHDSLMTRTTGMNKKVSQVTYEQIQNLDAGIWFSKKYKGTKVPTLREILELCKGKIQLNIELKAGKDMPDLEEKVVQLIEEYDYARQCVITSVYKDSLRKVKKNNKEIRTGYILSNAYGRYYLDEEIDFLSMRSAIIDERVVRMAHTYGKMICAWTVNSKNEAIRMKQLGVDNIITDTPYFVRNALYEEEGSSIVVRLLKLSF